MVLSPSKNITFETKHNLDSDQCLHFFFNCLTSNCFGSYLFYE